MVSIVIPVFNRKSFVEEMINCIIFQTYSDWELILVDDGSTDGTIEMMVDYSVTDSRVQVFNRDRSPKGGQTCRNIGFNKASGEYIVFFDSDDLVSRTCLEKRVELMELNKEIDYGIFPTKSFMDAANFDKMLEKDFFWGVKKDSDDLSLFLSANYPHLVVTNIYRRKALIENKISWDENVLIYQDFAFLFSTLICGLKYDYLSDKTDYYYRLLFTPDKTSSSQTSKEKFESVIYLFTIVLDVFEKRLLPRSYKKYFFSFVLFYYKNIINTSSYERLDEYLQFCKKKFSYATFMKLNIGAKISRGMPNKRLSQIIFKYFLSIFFIKPRLYYRIIAKTKRFCKFTKNYKSGN